MIARGRRHASLIGIDQRSASLVAAGCAATLVVMRRQNTHHHSPVLGLSPSKSPPSGATSPIALGDSPPTSPRVGVVVVERSYTSANLTAELDDLMGSDDEEDGDEPRPNTVAIDLIDFFATPAAAPTAATP